MSGYDTLALLEAIAAIRQPATKNSLYGYCSQANAHDEKKPTFDL